MTEDTEPQEDVMDAVADFAAAEASIQEEANEEPQEQQEPTQVPLSALQKERKKRQELEQELNYLRQRSEQIASTPRQEPEDDSYKYESATKEDLMRAQHEAVRAFEERTWIRNNPDRFEKVNELLPGFLKLRPNYASAINDAPNRYEEAYSLMEAFNPKSTAPKVATAQKKVAPNAPGGIPKAAALNEAVDLMKMSDAEFSAWRKAQKRR